MNHRSVIKAGMLCAASIAAAAASAQADHLLLSEIGVDPVFESGVAISQYVEIFNPTTATISLDNYFLTDSNLYTSVTMTAQVDTGTSDNILQFPTGHTLQPGQLAVVTHHSDRFLDQSFKSNLGYFNDLPGEPLLFEVIDSRADTPDMISRNSAQSTESEQLNLDLAFAGEFVVLFHWDGATPRVQDVDITAWRNPSAEDRFAPKGDHIKGADGSPYLPDNGSHGSLQVLGQKLILTRTGTYEAFEERSGGNGITGHDESTERGPHNWTVEATVPKSPGLTELVAVNGNRRPVIGEPTRTPTFPNADDPVELGATVTDRDGTVAEVAVYVDGGNGFIRHSAALTTANNYRVTVGPFPEGTIVKFYIEAKDNDGAVSWLWPYGAMAFETFLVESDPIVPGEVVINEILYSHVGPDTYEFVELYNNRPTAIRLSYSTFLDTELENLKLPEDAAIPGNGFMVLTRDAAALHEQFEIPPGVQVYDWGRFSLNTPDRVRLIHTNSMDFNRLSQELQNVYYTTQSPWPVYDINAGNRSIELKHPTYPSHIGDNWAVSDGDATPGLPNSVLQSAVADWAIY